MSSILHVLDHSRPTQSGYASRSHAILSALAAAGVPVAALTSPKHGEAAAKIEHIDGIAYHRSGISADRSVDGVSGQLRTIRATRRILRRLIAETNASVIHAHSPCLNGLAGLGLGRPLVYEMRSSWEDAAVSEGKTTEGSLRYRMSRALETFVARRADAVTVICEGLKNDLLGRGVSGERITVVPNALPERLFELPSDMSVRAVREKHNLKDAKVIGYFGSFFEWEGVDALVAAMPGIVSVLPDARLLLAGSGRTEGQIKAMIRSLNLSDHVVMAGRVQPDDMSAYYGAADVMAYPRVSRRLTELVTPLKPLEAMAQRTPVVASDIGGHRELIEDGRTGFLYSPQKAEGLGETILQVLRGRPDTQVVVDEARDWVDRERRWSAVCERYKLVYSGLAG